jgi:hypothetical protein
VIAVDVRCAGRSEKLPDGFTLPDIAEGLYTLLRALIPDGAVDVIGAALGPLTGALLVILLPGAGARFDDVRGRGRHAQTYLAEWANTVWAVGMPGVAEASLANSFPAPHPQQRSAYPGWQVVEQHAHRSADRIVAVTAAPDIVGQDHLAAAAHALFEGAADTISMLIRHVEYGAGLEIPKPL